VLGSSGAGASTALATLAGLSGGRWLPRAAEAAWDTVADLLDAPEPGVVVMDDLDALMGRMPPEHRTEFADRLVRLAREGPAQGVHLAASMRRIPGELQVLASLLPARLLLRHASRHELVLAGGDGTMHDPDLVPGAGTWLGARVQVAVGGVDRPADPAVACEPLDRDRPLAVVTTRPAAVVRHLSAAGYGILGLEGQAAAGPRSALVGDVDEWQSRWGALAAIRPVASVVFDGCSAGDLRQLARIRLMPPPLTADQAWLLRPDGAVVRTRLPG
jgi:S-DNA-T family DNA segregation ATPase FtsK/SpoIIIE